MWKARVAPGPTPGRVLLSSRHGFQWLPAAMPSSFQQRVALHTTAYTSFTAHAICASLLLRPSHLVSPLHPLRCRSRSLSIPSALRRPGGKPGTHPYQPQHHPRERFLVLSRFSDLRPRQADQLLEAALALLSSGVSEQVDLVARTLGERESGARLYLEGLLASATAVASQEAAAVAWRLRQHLPQLLGLLQVLCHGALCDHLTTKPWLTSIFVAVRGSTNLDTLATGMERLLQESPARPPLPIPDRSELADKISTWLDVAWLLTSLVSELLRRFQSADDRDTLRGPAERLLGAAEKMLAPPPPDRSLATGCPASGNGNGAGSRLVAAQASRAKRVQTAIRNTRSMLNIGASGPGQMTHGRAAANTMSPTVAEQAAAIPDSLPGHLRPGGPRHGNDHEDFTQIAVVPSVDELLSEQPPYLPANRSGLVPEHLCLRGSAWARLDTLFRLMRQDALAPLAEALRSFVAAGGVRTVRKGAAKQDAPAAGPQRDLFAYTDVRLDGLSDDFIRVSIQPPAAHVGNVQGWWEASKRLSVGTLIALAWETPPSVANAAAVGPDRAHAGGTGGPWAPANEQLPAGPTLVAEQQLAIGEVVWRQKEVGGDGRPCVGIRFASGQEEVLEALVTGVAAGCEVVMVQDKNAFFAYRPVLAALQGMAASPFPLAEYLLPASRSEPDQPKPGVPAYLQDGAVYDLSPVVDKDMMDRMDAEASRSARQHLAAVPVSRPDDFPVAALVAASSLDEAQAAALKAMLCQEVAVVQGPPGTGKTYLSIQATRVMLGNTEGRAELRSSWSWMAGGRGQLREPDPPPPQQQSGDGPRKPVIGPLLVVTFTNHALDQYLEGLLDAGVTDIVRVGSGSKNERMQAYNLANRIGKPRPMYRFKALRSSFQELDEELQLLLGECRLEAAPSAGAATRTGALLPAAKAPRLPAAATALTWYQLKDTLSMATSSYDLRPLMQSFEAGQRRRNRAGLRDLLGDWLSGSPSSDARLSRLGVAEAGMAEAAMYLSASTSRTSEDGGGRAGGSEAATEGQEEEEDGVKEGDAEDDDVSSATEGQAEGLTGDPDYLDFVGGADRRLLESAKAAGRQAQANMERLLISGLTGEQAPQPSTPPPQPPQAPSSERRPHQQTAAAAVASATPSAAEVAAMMARDRPLEELLRAGSVWEMSRTERRRLYLEFRRLRLASLASEIMGLQQELRAELEAEQVELDKLKLDALRRARVVGMTTSGLAASQKLIQALGPKVVIVEEAAEVFEAHVLTCLVRSVEHLVLVGDHEQLRPKANTFQMQAYSGKGYNLDVSLFERLVTGGWPVSALQQQRRMRPQIADLIRREIYPRLIDHPLVSAYPPVRGMVHNVYLWDHTHPDRGGGPDESGRSRSNPWEAAAAVSLARYLVQQGYPPEDIVVLVPYVGQLLAVRQELKKRNFRIIISEEDADQILRQGGPEGDEEEQEVLPEAVAGGAAQREARSDSIRVATVDNFQGEEARIIIVSTTCSNADAYIGFLKMRNRVNVMLSRAKHGMFILANTATLLSASNTRKTPLWASVREQLEAAGCLGFELPLRCENHGTITRVRELADFERLVGDGGCNQPCGALLPCGHTCPRRCHTDDPAHERTLCVAPCDRLHSPCGHPCDKLCNQECGSCERIISAHPLGCGHIATNMPCATITSGSLVCTTPREVEVPGCRHVLTVPCHTAPRYLVTPELCFQPVEVQMAVCGHTVGVPCGQHNDAKVQPRRCHQQCGCTLGCHHTCKGDCGSCTTRRISRRFGLLAAKVGFSGVAGGSSSDNTQRPQSSIATTSTAAADDAWQTVAAVRLGRRQAEQERQEGEVDSEEGQTARSKANQAEISSLLSYAASHNQIQLLNADLAMQLEGHAACSEICDRSLVCGHSCEATCHRGQDCPACNRTCWIACEHHRCLKPCGEPCVPCASACGWSCEHKGACGAPCGAPCDRLPCDERCTKLLPCGHRCPGLCGEPCPPANYCVHVDCRERLPQRIRQQVVDFLELRTFEDLADADVTADPLVVLPQCGHVYTSSTLDGHMQLDSRFYVRGPPQAGSRLGPWNGLRPFTEGQDSVKGCPDCRAPIQGVRRYGRATRKAALDLIDRKHLASGARQLSAIAEQVRGVEQELAAWPQAPEPRDGKKGKKGKEGKKEKGRHDDVPPAQSLQDIIKRLEAAAGRYFKLAESLRRGPKRRVYEAAVARIKKRRELAAEEHAVQLAAQAAAANATEPTELQRQSQAASAAAGGACDKIARQGTNSDIALFHQQASGAGASDSSCVAGGNGGGGGADGWKQYGGGNAGPVVGPFEAAERALHLLQDDRQGMWAARCGYLAAMEGVLHAATKGVEAPDSVLARGRRRSDGQGTQRQVASMMMHAARRAAEVSELAFPSVRASAGPVEDGGRPRDSWVEQAALLRDTSSAMQLAAAVMSFQLAQVTNLQASKVRFSGLDASGRAQVEQLKQQQLALLDKVLDQARQAEGIYAASALAAAGVQAATLGATAAVNVNSAAGSSDAFGPAIAGGSSLLARVKVLEERAVEARRQVERDTELLAIRDALEAVAKGDQGSFANMSRHLYRCKNGHVYVVGECSNPTEGARCAECGELIGLGSGDRRTDSFDASA